MKPKGVDKFLFFINILILIAFFGFTEMVGDCSVRFLGMANYLLVATAVPVIFFYRMKRASLYVSGTVLLHNIVVLTYLSNRRNRVVFCLLREGEANVIKEMEEAVRGEKGQAPNNVVVVLCPVRDTSSKYKMAMGTSKEDVANAVEKAVRQGEKERDEYYFSQGDEGYFLAKSLNIGMKIKGPGDLRVLMDCIQKVGFSRRFHGCILVFRNEGFKDAKEKMIFRESMQGSEVVRFIGKKTGKKNK